MTSAVTSSTLSLEPWNTERLQGYRKHLSPLSHSVERGEGGWPARHDNYPHRNLLPLPSEDYPYRLKRDQEECLPVMLMIQEFHLILLLWASLDNLEHQLCDWHAKTTDLREKISWRDDLRQVQRCVKTECEANVRRKHDANKGNGRMRL